MWIERAVRSIQVSQRGGESLHFILHNVFVQKAFSEDLLLLKYSTRGEGNELLLP